MRARQAISRVVMLLGILSLSATTAGAQSQAIEASAEDLLEAFVEAFNSGQKEPLIGFIEAHMVPNPNRTTEDRSRALARISGDLGVLENIRIIAGGSHEVSVVAKPSKRPHWVQFVLALQADPPHRIESIGIEMIDDPDAVEAAAREIPESLTKEELWTSLQEHLQERVRADEFSGVVLVAHNGEPVFRQAVGLASKSYDVPNRLDTRFNVGSITKAFTKVAVGQLLAKGELSLDDPLIKYLPDYPNHEVAEKVTVGQLVDHTSGLGDIFNDRFMQSDKSSYKKPEDFFPLFADEPLLFEPGEDRRYSNAGYIVLGAVVQAAAGEDYFDYIRMNVFEPAGMVDSGFFDLEDPVQNVASGYTHHIAGAQEKRRSNLYLHMSKGCPAGGSYSSAADLVRFDTALRSEKLLNARYTGWFFGDDPEKVADAGSKGYFGGAMGIAGGAPGINAALESGDGYAVAVLANYDPPAAGKVARWIWQRLKRLEDESSSTADVRTKR